jgi:hypothetical protein
MNRDAKHKLYTACATVQRYIEKIKLDTKEPLRLVISDGIMHDADVATQHNLYERIMDALQLDDTIGEARLVDEFSPPTVKRKKKK